MNLMSVKMNSLSFKIINHGSAEYKATVKLRKVFTRRA